MLFDYLTSADREVLFNALLHHGSTCPAAPGQIRLNVFQDLSPTDRDYVVANLDLGLQHSHLTCAHTWHLTPLTEG